MKWSKQSENKGAPGNAGLSVIKESKETFLEGTMIDNQNKVGASNLYLQLSNKPNHINNTSMGQSLANTFNNES